MIVLKFCTMFLSTYAPLLPRQLLSRFNYQSRYICWFMNRSSFFIRQLSHILQLDKLSRLRFLFRMSIDKMSYQQSLSTSLLLRLRSSKDLFSYIPQHKKRRSFYMREMLERDRVFIRQFLERKYFILKNRQPYPKGLLSSMRVSIVLLQQTYLQKGSKDVEFMWLSAKFRQFKFIDNRDLPQLVPSAPLRIFMPSFPMLFFERSSLSRAILLMLPMKEERQRNVNQFLLSVSTSKGGLDKLSKATFRPQFPRVIPSIFRVSRLQFQLFNSILKLSTPSAVILFLIKPSFDEMLSFLMLLLILRALKRIYAPLLFNPTPTKDNSQTGISFTNSAKLLKAYFSRVFPSSTILLISLFFLIKSNTQLRHQLFSSKPLPLNSLFPRVLPNLCKNLSFCLAVDTVLPWFSLYLINLVYNFYRFLA